MEDHYIHHGQSDPAYFYLFLVLAPILAGTVIYVGMKIANRLEKRSDNNTDETNGLKDPVGGPK
jgi:hypothetical protein